MKRIINSFLALCCLILCVFLLVTTLSRQDSPPEGFPITVSTRSGETVYFKKVHIDFVDSWHPNNHNSSVFHFETDAGQLTVSKELEGVLFLEVLQLPDYSSEQKKVLPALETDDDVRGSNLIRNQMKHKEPQQTLLLCRVRLKFATGKILEGNVTVYPDRNDSRVWGATPEGTRHMTLSDTISIELPEEEKKGR